MSGPMTYQARQYGRDGDTYGRHALTVPGGDNRYRLVSGTQRDVLHIIPTRYRNGRRIHPTRFDPNYVGAHRLISSTGRHSESSPNGPRPRNAVVWSLGGWQRPDSTWAGGSTYCLGKAPKHARAEITDLDTAVAQLAAVLSRG